MDSEYQKSLKSLDTEEHIDLYFYRRIGYFWAKLARRMGVTPNAITVASIFLGIGAGVAFYFDNYAINLVGILLLVWANSFDSADGQLARMTGQYSRIGRILDGLSGDIWFVTIYVAICLRENMTSHFFMNHSWLIWVIAAVAGLCHAKQAAMADYYRQFHLFFLKGKDGSELENLTELRLKYRQLSWSRNFWQKLVMTFYVNYTRNQEAWTPSMQRLRADLRRKWGNEPAPQAFRDEFRRGSLPLMKYTNILSFNWRTITLFCAILLRMPWIYFAAEIVIFTSILVYMMVRHEQLCRRMQRWINEH